MTKYWGYIVGFVGFIAGLFFLSKDKNKELKEEDKKLETKQKENNTLIQEEKTKMVSIPKPKEENLTPKEVEQFWKDKK